MEKIELRAIDAPAGYKHLYIVYTNDLGREFIVRAGPGPFTAFDYIDVEWGQYTSTSRDWVPPENRVPQDTSLITEGSDLSDTFLKMAFFAQLVEEADVDYDTLGAVISGSNNATNSNTMASACLNFAGLPVTLADLPSSAPSNLVPGYNNFDTLNAALTLYIENKFGGSISSPQALNSLLTSMANEFVVNNMWNFSGVPNHMNGAGYDNYRPDLIQNCFSCKAIISSPSGDMKISEVVVGDKISSFDCKGNLTPSFVTDILNNVTDTWLHLSNGTYVTPGHRYLRPDGSFMEIQDIVAGDGQIVAEDGSVLTVTAEVIHYSEETRHLFEEAEILVHRTEGGLAMAPEIKRGWKTYNFTVAETHTYIADGIRVHNESVLSSLRQGDELLAVDDTLSDAAVLRDTNGDGRMEVVLLDGIKYGGNTIVMREYVYTAPSSVSDVRSAVLNKMTQIDGDSYTTGSGNFTVDIYGSVFDPGRGNGPGDGRVSDDMDEMLIDDLGFSRTLSASRYIEIGEGFTANQVSRAMSGTTLLLYLTHADGTVETVSIPNGSDVASVRLATGASIAIGSIPSTTPRGVGTSGADNLGGTAGNDLIDGLAGNDTIWGGAGNDRLHGNTGDDQLLGEAGNDSLFGGAGNDYLVGGAGADYLDGGAGIDWAQYDTATAAVRVELLTPGNNTGDAQGDRYAGIENLYGSSYNDTLFGNAGNNTIWGNAGNDSINGFGGNDTLKGEAGNDSLIGGAGNDSLEGDDGNDFLQGDAGNDTLRGGNGIDTALYLSGTTAIQVDLAIATAQATGLGTDLLASIENVNSGGGNDTLLGNAGANVLNGGAGNDSLVGRDGNDNLLGGAGNDTLGGGNGNDTLNGGLGADRMTGAAGNDVFFVDDAGDVIDEQANGGTDQINASIGIDLNRVGGAYANVENVVLQGTANINALGSAANNTLTGNGGNNVLNGRGGNDSIAGGAGNDTLHGEAGNDTLNGGGGADSMTGGLGNDVYWVDVAGDRIVEVANGGTDLVNATVGIDLDNANGAYANVEDVTLQGTANINAFGSSGNNALSGNAGNNAIHGRDGNDVLLGGAGNDSLYGGAGNDTLNGGAGADSMAGGLGDDVYNVDNVGDIAADAANGGTDRINATISIDLNRAGGVYANVENVWLQGSGNINAQGSFANNNLTGNSGANLLSGRGGNDVLTGAAGADTFVFGQGFAQDVITDFEDNTDTIQLMNLGVTTFAQARTHATQNGADVVFDFGSGDTLTVRNTTINALADDMIFS